MQRNHCVAVLRAEDVSVGGGEFDRLGETLAIGEKRDSDMPAVDMKPNGSSPVVKPAQGPEQGFDARFEIIGIGPAHFRPLYGVNFVR
ncbi:MAG: hypothetical protein ACRD7E_33110 [Bryobacteraceae bacterium]